MTPALAPADVRKRVERDVKRAVARGRNGLRYAAGTNRPKVGQTPKDVVWRRHKAELWRYRSEGVRYSPPVVIVHSLVSRSYVLDLYPGNSAVAFFAGSGLDVLLVDWGVADEVTLLGYCFGGVLSLLAGARHPELPVRNLVVMATPVDFEDMRAIAGLVREGRLEPDELLDETGNVPPEAIEGSFRLLKPTGDAASYANLWQHLWNDAYVEGYQAMSQWTRDHVPFPGAAFRQTAEELVRRNALCDGGLVLGGEPVDLGAIRCPVLNVMAERDHIVPLPAAEPVTRLVGSDEADELRLGAGHVGLVAGRAAAKVTLPGIVDWITAHSDPTT